MQVVIAIILVVGTYLVMQLGKLLSSFHVGRILLRIVYAFHVHQRIEESKVAVHLRKLLLVGVVLACIVSQDSLAVAYGYNLRSSLAHMLVTLQCLQMFSKADRINSTIAEQPLDEQSVKCLEHALAFAVSRHVLLALSKSHQYLVAHICGLHFTCLQRSKTRLNILISKLYFLCHKPTSC